MSPTDQPKLIDKKDRQLTRLLCRLDGLLGKATQVSARFSRWRLAIFLTGVALSVAAYKLESYHLGNATLALFAAIFLIVAWYHSRLEDRMHRLRVWRKIKSGHLARLRLDWTGIPQSFHAKIRREKLSMMAWR